MMLLQTRLLYLKYSDSKQTTTENLGMYTVQSLIDVHKHERELLSSSFINTPVLMDILYSTHLHLYTKNCLSVSDLQRNHVSQ